MGEFPQPLLAMAPKQRTTFPAEVKGHDGKMLNKEWDAAERSIQNPAAFLAWGTADMGVKKRAFREQTKLLGKAAADKLRIEDFFDPDEVRKLYRGLHGDVRKSTPQVQEQWTALTDIEKDTDGGKKS